jgi:hypothetical protein
MSRSSRRSLRHPSFLDRAAARVDALPAFWQPPAIGAGFVLTYMAVKATYLAPVLLIGVGVALVREGPRALVAVPLVVAIAAIAGACGGLAYSFVGRTLQRIPRVGPYLTGWVVIGSYLAVVMELVTRFRLVRPRYHVVWTSPESVAPYMFCVLVFGAAFGWGLSHGEHATRRRWRQRVQRVTSRVPPDVT